MKQPAELTESLKLLKIKNECREKDEDFIKYALEKSLVYEEKQLLPLIKDYLRTKNRQISIDKLGLIGDLKNTCDTFFESITIYLNQAVAFVPLDSDILSRVYMSRGLALFNCGMYEESLKDIRNAIIEEYVDGKKASLYAKEVRILMILTRYKEAREVLVTANEWLSDTEPSQLESTRQEIKQLTEELKKCEPGGEFLSTLKFFPNLLWPKVIQRDNSIFLPTHKKEKEKEEEEEKEKEKKFERLADCVTLNHNDKLGYYLAASRDIKAGEPLLEDRVFVMVLNNDQRYLRCWNCTKFCWYCVPCEDCANVIFCSDRCRDLAMAQFHDIECQILSILLKHRQTYNVESLMSLRLFIKLLKEKKYLSKLQIYIQVIEKVGTTLWLNNEGYKNNIHQSVYHLFREPMEKESKDKHAFASVYYTYCLAATTNLFGKKIKNYKELMGLDSALFVVKLLFHHAMIVSSNMIPLKQFTLCKNAKVYGYVIHPILSLRNHSCNPNSYQFFSKDKVALTAIQCIEAGQPISTCYGPSCFKLSTDERRDILFNKHGFKCECEACINDWGPSKRFPSCLNHFKNADDCSRVRSLLNTISMDSLIKRSQERMMAVSDKELTTTLTGLFELINAHDQPKPQQCIQMEAVKHYLCRLYDFIDNFEM